jgi:ACS family D-galactonate transporter-like MFS transporter
MALLTGFFYFGQTLGAAFSGGLTDRLIAGGRSSSAVRRGVGLLASAVSAVGIVAIAQTTTTSGLIFWLAPTSLSFGTITGILFVAGQTLAGPASAGRWVGVQSGVGNLAGVFGPVITGAIVDKAGYGPTFLLTAGIVVAGALAYAFGVPRVAPVDWQAAR